MGVTDEFDRVFKKIDFPALSDFPHAPIFRMILERVVDFRNIEDNAAILGAASIQDFFADMAREVLHLEFLGASFGIFIVEKFFALTVQQLRPRVIDQAVRDCGERRFNPHRFGMNRRWQIVTELHTQHLGTGIESERIPFSRRRADIVANRIHRAIPAGGHDHRLGVNNVGVSAAVIEGPAAGYRAAIGKQPADDRVAQDIDIQFLAFFRQAFHEVLAGGPMMVNHPRVGVPLPRTLIVFSVIADEVETPAQHFFGQTADRIGPGLDHFLIAQSDAITDHVAEMDIGIVAHIRMTERRAESRQGLG